MSYEEKFTEWDNLGELEVRVRLASNQFRMLDRPLIEKWLKLKEAESKNRADAREEESLKISRDALDVSKHSRRLSFVAIIVSVVTAISVAIYTSN